MNSPGRIGLVAGLALLLGLGMLWRGVGRREAESETAHLAFSGTTDGAPELEPVAVWSEVREQSPSAQMEARSLPEAEAPDGRRVRGTVRFSSDGRAAAGETLVLYHGPKEVRLELLLDAG